jgi:ketosteroid isomerase-like protein
MKQNCPARWSCSTKISPPHPLETGRKDMTPESSRATNEAAIRERLEDWAKAVRAKDIERVISNYAPDILLFDLAPPLQYRGADSCRKNWAEWFHTFQGEVGYEIRELSITSDGDVAFCHNLNRIHGTRSEGTGVASHRLSCLRSDEPYTDAGPESSHSKGETPSHTCCRRFCKNR